MKKLKLAKIPRKLGSKITSVYTGLKQLKRDARDEGINMFVDFKGRFRSFTD
jgi:hypothetical protein